MKIKKEAVSKSAENLQNKERFRTLLLELSDVAVAKDYVERAIIGLSGPAFSTYYDSTRYRQLYIKLQKICKELRNRSDSINRLLEFYGSKLEKL